MAGQRDPSQLIRVLIVDDEPLVRQGLRAVLSVDPQVVVVGEAQDGAEAVTLARQHRPDLVLMDVRMPGIDGLRATQLLSGDRELTSRILVLTTFENDEYVYEALRAGASGFLLKRTPPERLLEAVHLLVGGDSLLFPSAVRRLVESYVQPAPPPRWALTERETEVLRMLAQGASNAEISRQLRITVETVKTHVSRVLAKIGARDRVQAVIAAYESGFVDRA